MRSPDGQEFPNAGVYLEVVANERLVFTDAYTGAWEPSEMPFMTVILTFEDEGGKTKYTARARHWTVADRACEVLNAHAPVVNGEVSDSALYGLLRRDWQQGAVSARAPA